MPCYLAGKVSTFIILMRQKELIKYYICDKFQICRSSDGVKIRQNLCCAVNSSQDIFTSLSCHKISVTIGKFSSTDQCQLPPN